MPPASPAEADPGQRLMAIGLMCGAVLCFAGLDAGAKWLGQSTDPLLVVWARYAVSVALVCAVLNPATAPGVARTRRPGLQALRSILLFGSTALNFFALRHLQLAETVSIQFAGPLVVALVAGLLLGERIGAHRLAAILAGFVGVLVMTRPGISGAHPAMLLSLGSMLCYALYAVCTRVLAAHDGSSTTLFYSGLAGIVLLTPALPVLWQTPSDPLAWALMLAVGALGTLGHWLLILAHARAPAAILSPFLYTQLVWMVGLGYLVFGDWPDGWTLVGAGIVVLSGLYLLNRERAERPHRA